MDEESERHGRDAPCKNMIGTQPFSQLPTFFGEETGKTSAIKDEDRKDGP